MDNTEVINIKNVPSNWLSNPEYIYIGRAKTGLGDGKFGNPHPVGFECYTCYTPGKCVVHTQDQAVEAFDRYFQRRIMEDDEFLKAVHTLRGKKLVCYCKPKRCHGDVYVEFLRNLLDEILD